MSSKRNSAVAFMVLVSLLVGCGGYNSVTYMVPRTENGWTTQKTLLGLPIGYDYEFSCNGKSIGVSAPLVYSRRLAGGPFYIPIPYLKEQKPNPDISEPMQLMVSIQSAKISSCEDSMVSVSSQKMKTGVVRVNTLKGVGPRGLREFHNTARGIHFCIFETPPITEIGDELQVRFRNDLLDCEIPMLRFGREDSTKYIDGIGL